MGDTYRAVCGYFSEVYENPDLIIQRFKPYHNRLIKDNVDTLVGTGLSGGIIVPMLAKAYGMHYVIVRKEGTQTHDSSILYGVMGKKYIFVDDFIQSGETLRRIQKQLYFEIPSDSHEFELYGIYLYSSSEGEFFYREAVKERVDWFWEPPKIELKECTSVIDPDSNMTYKLWEDNSSGCFYGLVREGIRTAGTEELFTPKKSPAGDDEVCYGVIISVSSNQVQRHANGTFIFKEAPYELVKGNNIIYSGWGSVDTLKTDLIRKLQKQGYLRRY